MLHSNWRPGRIIWHEKCIDRVDRPRILNIIREGGSRRSWHMNGDETKSASSWWDTTRSWVRSGRSRKPPRIGLALGGGFARGIAHVGVLRVFEQNNIPIS